MKFVTDKPLPNPYQNELLTITIEECAEVAQRVTKLMRFGAAEVQPGQVFTNVQRMSREMGQLQWMFIMLAQHGLIDADEYMVGFDEKLPQLKKYMQNEEPAL